MNKSLNDIIQAYQKASDVVQETFKSLQEAETTLKCVHPNFQFKDFSRNYRFETDEVLTQLKKDTWRFILERLEIRKFVSLYRMNQIDMKVSHGDLPDINIENVRLLAEQFQRALPDIHTETIHEVLGFIKPRYDDIPVRKKVKLKRWLEPACEMYFKVRKSYELAALENVFKVLDHKCNNVTNFRSDLEGIVENTRTHGDGKCSTEYFEATCFRSGNLHITFLRDDLLAKINETLNKTTLKSYVASVGSRIF